MLRSESVEQMMDVLVRFREKYRRNYSMNRSHIEAIEEVAAQYRVRPQTIRDLCFRRLDLASVDRFRDLLEKWVRGDAEPLRKVLRQVVPKAYQGEIDAVLAEGATAAAPAADVKAGRRLDESFTISLDPESAKKVKVLALMQEVSSVDWLREKVRQVLGQEYGNWLNSEKAK
ncbi:MAG: hypothetical protein IH624_02555 [Phycisphaerae bacterium]|nr:hypothetical protein [Phycisphaerae bacterium]